MALMGDGLQFHVERGFVHVAMAFAGRVEALTLWRRSGRRARDAA